MVAGLAPAEAADEIARDVTGAHPLLFPNAIPDGWRGELSQSEDDDFTVIFYSPDRAKRILFAIGQANLPDPELNTDGSAPNFHGDARSVYQVDDRTDRGSFRHLIWSEKGTWATVSVRGGVPYYLQTHGLTDAEFWQLANSLHPIQR